MTDLATRALALHERGVIRLDECKCNGEPIRIEGPFMCEVSAPCPFCDESPGLDTSKGAILLACVRAGVSVIATGMGSGNWAFSGERYEVRDRYIGGECPVDAALSALEAANE